VTRTSTALETVWSRYEAFLREPPETILAWTDPLSEARGWLVLNSRRGGAAGGGTRMRRGLGRDEVVYLAKIMELKFALSGPAIGGAKSGIDFDPSDPRREEVLERWFAAIEPFLRSCYGTAGDLNVDEARDVVPLCRSLGIRHPQEGVARGHFRLEGEALAARLEAIEAALHGRADAGRAVPAADDLRVIDLVTGYGVARATLRLLELQGRDPAAAPALVEGFGNVGGAATWYLARAGVPIAGIVDARHGLVPEAPLGPEAVAELLRRRRRNLLPVEPARGAEDRRRFERAEGTVYVCAAASGTLDAAALDGLEARGVEIVASGANRPFAAAEPGDTRLEREADGRFAVIADVVANCGAARSFYHFMRGGEPDDPGAAFDSIADLIEGAVDEAASRAGNPRRGLLAAALDMTMERAAAGGGDPA